MTDAVLYRIHDNGQPLIANRKLYTASCLTHSEGVVLTLMESTRRFGLSCARALPLHDGSIDYCLLVTHARACLEAGCSCITVFGTTGEGASISLAERAKMVGALLSAGIDPRTEIIGGIASASIGDAVEQIRILQDAGCSRVLLAPPFYFKGVQEDGLYDWFAWVLEKIAGSFVGAILYHIPSVTQVPLSLDLISRLRTAFPGGVIGIKDSGGEWSFTKSLLGAHADLSILIGDERHLAAAVRLGATGAISGLANLCPKVLLPLIELGKDDSRITDLVTAILKYPVTPAVKALLFHLSGNDRWLKVRPPLVKLAAEEVKELGAVYDGLFRG
jgi:4-hydroxy-tetrahydrodipicolinate synthase